MKIGEKPTNLKDSLRQRDQPKWRLDTQWPIRIKTGDSGQSEWRPETNWPIRMTIEDWMTYQNEGSKKRLTISCPIEVHHTWWWWRRFWKTTKVDNEKKCLKTDSPKKSEDSFFVYPLNFSHSRSWRIHGLVERCRRTERSRWGAAIEKFKRLDQKKISEFSIAVSNGIRSKRIR